MKLILSDYLKALTIALLFLVLQVAVTAGLLTEPSRYQPAKYQ